MTTQDFPNPRDLRQHLARAEALCGERGATLLFLTLSGSSLYGTRRPGKSDLDLRGLFLPGPEALALGEAPDSLRWTGGGTERRNTADDVDLDLWSLQYWLLHLLPTGDLGALDLLFAPSYPACVLYTNPLVESVFAHPEKLANPTSNRALDYSLAQARKYGAKGARVRALRRVVAWLEARGTAVGKLADCLTGLAEACGDPELCRVEEAREGPALRLCGKLHLGHVRLADFATRARTELEGYGERALDAAGHDGVDFKALAHAARALFQAEELLLTGRIVFPLRQAAELRAIRAGERPWPELGTWMRDKLAEVKNLQKAAAPRCAYDADFARNQILVCCGLAPRPPKTPPTSPGRADAGFDVPAPARAAIMERLRKIECEHDVLILYACESGSRGWGFASAVSDFDARFIYVHPPDWYLGLAPEERRDVLEPGIEQTPAGELDMNGWELRKALKLFRGSNAPLLEWLSSPIVYLETGTLAERLRALAPALCSPLKLRHHYSSLMLKSRDKYRETSSIKSWFYMLRPLLALQWLSRSLGPPPMRLDRLMDGVIADGELRAALDVLVELKRSGAERAIFTPPDVVAAWLETSVRAAESAPDPPPPPRHGPKIDLDALFRATLSEVW